MNRLIFSVSAVLLVSCSQENSYIKNQGVAMGTTYNIVYQSNIDLRDSILVRINSYDASMSVFNSESLVSRINRNETDTIDQHFATIYTKAQEIHALSGGAFDITLRPLIRTWRFGGTTPDTISIAQYDSTLAKAREVMTYCGIERTRIDGNRIVKSDPRTQFDANALAEGYGIDLIAAVLEEHGVENYMVELGGELHLRGVNPMQKPWRIGIDQPNEGVLAERKNHHIIQATNCAISTSGSYRQYYYRADSVRLAHTIDPRTCAPAQHGMLSVTIIAPNTLTSDALSTACMVLGPDSARTMIDKLTDVEMFMIYKDGKGVTHEYMTSGYKQLIVR